MKLQTQKVGVISIDPYSQESINVAKIMAAGEGVGPAVSSVLAAEISNGNVTQAEQLPLEYRHLLRILMPINKNSATPIHIQ